MKSKNSLKTSATMKIKKLQLEKALAQGKSIYVGCIDYEIAEDTINGLIKTLWEKLNEVEENKITIIDDDLDY